MIALVLNGPAGAGKGKVAEFIGEHFDVKPYKRSSIAWAKETAESKFGWDGKKDPRSRAMLGEIKQLGIKYGDIPTNDLARWLEWAQGCIENYDLFITDIREPDEIDKFVRHCRRVNVPSITCRVLNAKKETEAMQELAGPDNCYAGYDYDLHIDNNGTLDDLRTNVISAFESYFR